jgi:hypothetical protein
VLGLGADARAGEVAADAARAYIDVKKSTGAWRVDSLLAVELRSWFSGEARGEVAVFGILRA